MTMMDDLIAFLRARLDEDQKLYGAMLQVMDMAGDHDPESDYRIMCTRLLAEADAKRQIIELLQREFLDDGEETWGDILYVESFLKLLALPYAGHPDYYEAWRP